jgi:hypothetical protein
MTGQKIKTVFSGYMNAGRQRFSMNVPSGKLLFCFMCSEWATKELLVNYYTREVVKKETGSDKR